MLVRFDPELNAFRPLDDAAAKLIYEWEGQRDGPSALAPNTKLKSRWKRWVRRMAGDRLSESIRSFLQTWKQSRRRRVSRPASKATSDQIASSVLFLWNHRILFPELMLEPSRLEAIKTLLTNAPMATSMLLYDLIPLHHPDFFSGSVDGFMRYLTLLRSVDRVSCISKAVEHDLRQLLPLLGRQKPPAELATHYLGCDFDFAKRTVDEEPSDDLPVVLSVGTLEVRKNQRRILRAIIAAQARGYQFKGVFAGNPGWLNEAFEEEVAHFQERGYRVEVRHSVSEAELRRLYGQARITLFCSLAEGFGLPIVESVVKGIPCITSDRGCMKEIAESLGGCRLVNPESEDEIANAIVELFQDRPKYERLKEAARRATWPTWRDYACHLYDFSMRDNSSKPLFVIVSKAA